MLVIGVYLEQGIAFSLRSDWLIHKRFEADESSEDHLKQSVVDPTLPIVIVFFHDR